MNEDILKELIAIRESNELISQLILKKMDEQISILNSIRDLLTPTNLTVSQEYIDEEVKKITYTKEKEGDSGKNDLDKIRDILDIHTGKQGGRS